MIPLGILLYKIIMNYNFQLDFLTEKSEWLIMSPLTQGLS